MSVSSSLCLRIIAINLLAAIGARDAAATMRSLINARDMGDCTVIFTMPQYTMLPIKDVEDVCREMKQAAPTIHFLRRRRVSLRGAPACQRDDGNTSIHLTEDLRYGMQTAFETR